MSRFKKAERLETFIKIAVTGVAGSGKTYGSLLLARGLVGPNGRIAFIDTENRSATLYADLTPFDHFDLAPKNGVFNSEDFTDAAAEAEESGYDCLIIDSSSHLWQAILDLKSSIDKKGADGDNRYRNQYTNWNEPSSKFTKAIQMFLQSRMHVISCMRSKMEYDIKKENGKTEIQKLSLAPIMRDAIEYEFTTIFDVLLPSHKASVSKDRTGLFSTNSLFQITEDTGKKIADWLSIADDAKNRIDMVEEKIRLEFLGKINDATSIDELEILVPLLSKSTLSKTKKDVLRKAYGTKLQNLKGESK